jgi:hypothetical protein
VIEHTANVLGEIGERVTVDGFVAFAGPAIVDRDQGEAMRQNVKELAGHAFEFRR